MKYLLIFIILSLSAAGAYFLLANQDSAEKFTPAQFIPVENSQAAVNIAVFSDFQCPYCAIFHETLSKIARDYPNDVNVVYKYFPLDQIHSNARPAAEAAECAAEQGKFWEFADGLFENQSKLNKDFYNQLALEIGLDMDQFGTCFSSRKYKNKVESNYQAGLKAGVKGTPTSFVNGEFISGAVSYNTLKAAVERALKNKQ